MLHFVQNDGWLVCCSIDKDVYTAIYGLLDSDSFAVFGKLLDDFNKSELEEVFEEVDG
jgi:hypothetical protein